jgi:hypothetical protein
MLMKADTERANSTRMISRRQVKMIHTLISQLGYSDRVYRFLLKENLNVTTCKDLNFYQAQWFIDNLEKIAAEKGVWLKTEGDKAFNSLGFRPGMASPSQLRKIEVLFRNVTTGKNVEARRKALRTFLSNRFHVSDLRFVDQSQVSKIVKALTEMGARLQEQRNAPETRESVQKGNRP